MGRVAWEITGNTRCDRPITFCIEDDLKQGVRHFSPLTIKTEMAGARFERNLWLAVPVLMGAIGMCQRPSLC